MTDLLIIVALLAANGFFVAAEFALVKARGFRIETLANEGRFGAALTVTIQAKLESYLAACQLGITMASLGLGWVGEPAVEGLLYPLFALIDLPASASHTVAFIVGFVLFSSLHIVVGEQVPKTFAIREPEPVSLWCAYPLHMFYVLCYPLNRLLTRATSAILALFRVEEAGHGDILSGEEIGALATKSGEHGSIAVERAEMVANLFAFDQRSVGRVMIPRGDVVVLDLAEGVDANMEKIRDSRHSRFPLVDGDPARPVGMVLSKDVFAAAIADGADEALTHLREMAREPVVVPELLRLPELFDTMRERHTHMAFVVDEYGEFVGLVTLEDLLEEIVGEIADETDSAVDAVALAAREGGWETSGLTTLADVGREIGLSVPPDLDANTLSGLMMQRLGRMPAVGDEIEEGGFRLKVVTMRDHHVDRLFVAPPPAPSGAGTSP